MEPSIDGAPDKIDAGAAVDGHVRETAIDPMDPCQRVIVVADGHAAAGGPDVELEAVTAGNGKRGPERRQRVLDRVPPIPAVGEAKDTVPW